MEITVQLGNDIKVPGSNPIVIIGANGVGKTRFGVHLVHQFGYDRIPALRGLSLGGIPMWAPEQAKSEVNSAVSNWRVNTSDTTNDIGHLFGDLKANSVLNAETYRKLAIEKGGNAGIPEKTQIEILSDLWNIIFPGRELDLDTYNPRAKWNSIGRFTDPYSTSAMSDGERSALYLAARVLQSLGPVIIVDEPEVHFHSLLARQFWDVVERARPDCRFVYITHDLSFAHSRRGRIAIVKDPTRADLLPDDAPIPHDLYESILGAASLSVVASRIVFCEGLPGLSIDSSFYDAWFRAPDTIVVPVGNCDAVRRTFNTFSTSDIVANMRQLAVVERDYWPDTHLQELAREGMHVLSMHEVEGLLCLRGVAEAVAGHIACNDFASIYNDFEDTVRQNFQGMRLHKLILERAKREIDSRTIGLANRANPSDTLIETRQSFIDTIDEFRKLPETGSIFDEIEEHVNAILLKNAEEFLRILPGKDCLGILCQKLGIEKSKYIQLIIEALNQPIAGGNPSFSALSNAIVGALTPHLPQRD